MSDAISFDKNLYKMRKKNGLSQEELAERLGVSYMTIRRWEAGTSFRPKITDIHKLCKIFSCTEKELLYGTPDENWTLELKIDNTVKEMIDMTENMPCIASITGTQNGALLTLSGKWDTFRDDAKFQDFIDQLVKARGKILRLGEDWGNEQ